MAKGDRFKSEVSQVKGDRAERPTLQLTDNGADNRHLYLYAPTFTGDGNDLIYISRRDGRSNYYRMDLSTFESIQITDSEKIEHPGTAWYLDATREIHYWDGPVAKAVNIDSLDERTIYDEGYEGWYQSVTCDGKFIVFHAPCKSVPGFSSDFDEHWTLMVVATDGSGHHPALTVPFRINHVQCSPADPERIVFCWEGSWQAVPQRMWWSDLEGLQGGPLGPQPPNERRGHEFFTPSGTRVGYHGSRFHIRRGDEEYFIEETASIVGIMNVDGTGDTQYECPGPTGHCQINFAEDLFVCDQGGARESKDESVALIHVEQYRGVFEPLFYHGSSWKTQGCHPHPQFRPGDEQVVFTTDYTSLSNIYLTSVGE